MWRSLVIGCFDWKIGVFQQTVKVRVYYILKSEISFHKLLLHSKILICPHIGVNKCIQPKK